MYYNIILIIYFFFRNIFYIEDYEECEEIVLKKE